MRKTMERLNDGLRNYLAYFESWLKSPVTSLESYNSISKASLPSKPTTWFVMKFLMAEKSLAKTKIIHLAFCSVVDHKPGRNKKINVDFLVIELILNSNGCCVVLILNSSVCCVSISIIGCYFTINMDLVATLPSMC